MAGKFGRVEPEKNLINQDGEDIVLNADLRRSAISLA